MERPSEKPWTLHSPELFPDLSALSASPRRNTKISRKMERKENIG